MTGSIHYKKWGRKAGLVGIITGICLLIFFGLSQGLPQEMIPAPDQLAPGVLSGDSTEVDTLEMSAEGEISSAQDTAEPDSLPAPITAAMDPLMGPPVALIPESADALPAPITAAMDSLMGPPAPMLPDSLPEITVTVAPKALPSPRAGTDVETIQAETFEGDSLKISPLWDFIPRWHPSDDLLFFRIYRTNRARAFILDTLGLYHEKFPVSDTTGFSIIFPEDMGIRDRERTTTQYAPDINNRTIVRYKLIRDVALGLRIQETYDQYLERLTRLTIHKIWREEVKKTLAEQADLGSKAGLVKIDLPVEVPSQLSPIFGKGKPNLSVRGSEKISIGGTSRWHPNRPVNEFQRRESKFPQLDMKQELNLRLSGNIGDKVSVDVDQNSAAVTPLENRIKIHYTGYEDEIIQRVDLGNTSLSLPGTRYVSYGGSHQGLFGINAQAKMGDVGLNMILSKQEGETASKTVTRSSEMTTILIKDLNYQGNQYFFFSDPNLNPTNIDANSVFVFVDDANGYNNTQTGAIHGFATLDGSYDPQNPTAGAVYEGDFDQLHLKDDFLLQTDLYFGHMVLILNQPLSTDDVLAVMYKTTSGFQVGGIDGDRLIAKMIRPSRSDSDYDLTDLTSGVWASTRHLEMKNIYWLGGRGILEESLEIKVRRELTSGQQIDPWKEGRFSYLQILGVDLLEQTGASSWEPSLEGDDIVDPQWIDPEGGFIIFPTLRPFDPSPADSLRMYGPGGIMASQGVNPDSIPILAPSVRNSDVYDAKAFDDDPLTHSKFYLDVTYRSPVTSLQIDAFNIIEGSEVITSGGRTLSRDRDYRIDYLTGDIEILPAANLSEDDEIKVNYSTIPFAGGADKSLFGFAAAYKPEGSPLALSSTWVFDSQGSQDRRPRLGQEPRRTAVGELAMSYQTSPWFLTSLIDALPGVDARARSSLSIDAGVGMSMPNPNTKNRLYLDDFDGTNETQDISVNRQAWRPSSIPQGVFGENETERAGKRGEIWFYSPLNVVHEGNLQPTLKETEADDSKTVLEMKIFPYGTSDEDRFTSWNGVTQAISRRDIDLSQAQFLDVWINDKHQYQEGVDPSTYRQGVLHLDFGIVSEDAVWKRRNPRSDDFIFANNPAEPPNLELDTEDKNLDGQLDQSSGEGEDTGLDGIPDGQAGDDPFDDWSFDKEDRQDDPWIYGHVNGTEKNGRLDTEDLNGNGLLNQSEAYFEFTIPLDDTTIVETDIYRDFGGGRWVDETNAWRRVRIPISAAADTIGSAAWNKIQHVRLWTEGFRDTTNWIQVGGIQMIGNRWLDDPILKADGDVVSDSFLNANNEAFFPGVLNNKENSDIYTPPFKVRVQNGVDEREQSLTLEMRNMPPGHSAQVYRTYARGQDFITYYETMEFYLNRRMEQESAEVDFYIRLAKDVISDTTNYYEYRIPVKRGWELITVPLADLSALKLVQDSTEYVERILPDGGIVSMKGKPTLTSVGRIAMGVRVQGDTMVEQGNVWVDELRLTGVRRDTGIAGRFSLSAKLSDVAEVNLNYERADADFLQVGSPKGSGFTRTLTGLNSRINMERFITWSRLVLPVSFGFQQDKRVPKYRVNSDIELRGQETDRDISESATRNFQMRISRVRTDNPLLKYTIDAMSGSYTYNWSGKSEPLSQDTTRSSQYSFSYAPQVSFRGLKVYKNTMFNPVPTSFGITSSYHKSESVRYQRINSDLAQDYERLDRQAKQKSAALSTSLGFKPIGPISYSLSSSRDLMVKEKMPILGLAWGRETSRKEQVSASTSVRFLSFLLGPKITPSVSFTGQSTLDLNRPGNAGDSLGVRINTLRNSRSTSLSVRFPIKELFARFSGGGSSKNSIQEGRDKGGGQDRNEEDDEETQVGDGGTTQTRQRKRSGPSPLARLLTVGNLNASYSKNLSTSYNRAQGIPDFIYRLGLTNDPGKSVKQLDGATSLTGDGDNLSLKTDFTFMKEVRVSTSYQRNNTDTRQIGGVSHSKKTTWPELDIEWGSLHKKIKFLADHLPKTLRASTKYRKDLSESGTGTTGRDRMETTTNWSPLLNLSTTLSNGVQLQFNSSKRNIKSEQFTPYKTVTNSNSRQFSLDLSKSMRITREVKVPLTGNVKKVQSKLDMTLGLEFREEKSQTGTNILRNLASAEVNTRGSYEFTKSIRGEGRISIGKDIDRKSETNTAWNVSVFLSASFSF
ncbi:MAG: cell surface protein SprA [Candidatus Eisenbacteria bacterium]|uniref:Cell surface protein SprA n=1 Tax=Eiseniibacteriota bacterium TaxID=2212470 RepID=A0A948RX17_UNCEI|nr:cell surface protein SprA [Candidatus Eisenbacteria bacterium]MBU1951201.1 cell surface protein SprA [Candidatus Eisenbacteria bacterium]MBU2690612.1 cell surface protein SprA [Candidatus Eisenbacteria bacterium]